MPEYLTPGVYIEEISIGAKPIEGVSTSTAGFLGQTERGPIDLRLITSFGQYQALYGGFVDNSYLAYAVDGFFRNGGQRCYIGRIVASETSTAIAELKVSGSSVIRVSALGPGDWGSHIAIKVEDASLTRREELINTLLFKLTIAYWSGIPPKLDDITKKLTDEKAKTATILEVYDNLSPTQTSSDYYLNRINGISNLVTLERMAVGRPGIADYFLEFQGVQPQVTLVNYEGITDPGKRTGLAAFEELGDISIVCIPDENNITGLTSALVTHCEKMTDRFAVCQAKQSAGSISSLFPSMDSKYASFYYPWITIIDPITNVNKLIPPGGHIAGVYARSDSERGVHKAPANEVLRGAVDLQINLTKGEQDVLNPRGVNCIRSFVGRGIRIWGARTCSSDGSWKYVNVRRLFIFVEKSIELDTQWVVFEPNDEKLWARVKQTINQFLTTVWRSGALMGSTQEEAFFVKCDRTTMTQDDIDNGRLIILIGIAPVKPAEFVIFRIAQVAKGSEISE
jgi:phage tail sheath protein FI